MSDRYTQIVNNPIGSLIAKNVGLPQPTELERYEPGQPAVTGPVLLGAAPGGRLAGSLAGILDRADAEIHSELGGEVRDALGAVGADAEVWNPDVPGSGKFKALVFDATGIKDSTELRELWRFFQPTMRRVAPSGRVIVLGTTPQACEAPRERTAQRALEGFSRAVGKELRYGATANLIYIAPGAENGIESTLRFFISPRSAYVSGQVVRLSEGVEAPEIDWEQPLNGKVALVTGASRGIGEAIARGLARDGAKVVGLDIPPLAEDLAAVMAEVGGSSICLDITSDEAPAKIREQLSAEHGGVDIVVHNAGVTKDKTLGGMDEERWSVLMEINLSSEERINDELLAAGTINDNGRIICVSSISGIAGNAGQTNYSTSKAGVIGMVQAMAPHVAEKKLTINAVAPGFIETAMTAAMPIGLREAGRRMNSLSQGGLPVDVAEAIAWYASPASGAANGNVVRVCGQSLIGA